jgi:dCMP deaminase
MYKTDEEYLLLAYQKATESPDPSTQNGAVIPYKQSPCSSRFSGSSIVQAVKTVVDGTDLFVSACNTFPKGVVSKPERLERPVKYAFIEHAERGAIFEACRSGVSTQGLTMFCPWFACENCGRAIICSGIKKVVGHKRMFDATPDHWKESIAHAFAMFEEAGIETVLVPGELNGPEIRFNGQLWKP